MSGEKHFGKLIPGTGLPHDWVEEKPLKSERQIKAWQVMSRELDAWLHSGRGGEPAGLGGAIGFFEDLNARMPLNPKP